MALQYKYVEYGFHRTARKHRTLVSITIEPLGGLGNQLFVYSLGRSLALRVGTSLDVDLANFVNYEWHDYELDSFASVIDKEFGYRTDPASRGLKALKRRSRKTWNLSRLWSHRTILVERSWPFDASFLQAGDGARLRGYFQSWRYFDAYADVIRSEVRRVSEPTPWFESMREELDALPGWTAIHVRRGNYVNLPNMGLVDEDYYRRAIELVETLVGSGPLVVFSDDSKLARQMTVLKERRDALFIDPPPESRPVESLNLMSMGNHAIIANSTFSWWASWLAHSEDRVVVAPRPWLDDVEYVDRDLILPSWITIGRHSS